MYELCFLFTVMAAAIRSYHDCKSALHNLRRHVQLVDPRTAVPTT
jgi:hypothetical protein